MVVGLVCVAFALRAAFSPLLLLQAPLGLALAVGAPHTLLLAPGCSSLSPPPPPPQFVLSGSLTLAALRRTSASLVSLGLRRGLDASSGWFLSWRLVFWVQVWAAALANGISALVGLVGVAYLGFLIASYRPAKLFCNDETWGNVTPSASERSDCLWKISLLDVSCSGREDAAIVEQQIFPCAVS